MIDYRVNQFRLFISTQLFLVRVKNWTLYFPSSFQFGSKQIDGLFKNWSFSYLTLERKD